MLQHNEIEEVFMKEKKHGPKKGAAKKWSERLKQIGQQTPPEDLLKILNETEKQKKSALPAKDLDI
jgi:hypothetical protein